MMRWSTSGVRGRAQPAAQAWVCARSACAPLRTCVVRTSRARERGLPGGFAAVAAQSFSGGTASTRGSTRTRAGQPTPANLVPAFGPIPSRRPRRPYACDGPDTHPGPGGLPRHRGHADSTHNRDGGDCKPLHAAGPGRRRVTMRGSAGADRSKAMHGREARGATALGPRLGARTRVRP